MLRKVRNNISDIYLYKQSFISLFIKILGAGFAFIFNILLARKLGAEDTGIFFLCFTVIMIAVVVGRLGLDNVVLREIARYVSGNKWGQLKGIFSYSMKITLISSFLMSLLIFFSADLISDRLFNLPEMSKSLRMMSLIIVPFALILIISSSLKGLKKIAQATIIESFLVPFFSALCLYFLVKDNNLNQFLNYYVIIFITSLLIAVYYWKKNTIFIKEKSSSFSIKEILDSSIPLLWVASMFFVNSWADRIFLGIYSNSESVGVYSIAMKVAMLVSFILVAVNNASSAKFSEFYQSNNIKELSNYCTKSTNLMVLISLPVLILFIFFSAQILNLFGSEFVIGSKSVIILCLGQFINVATGSVSQILAMSKRERLLKNAILIGLVSNIILNLLLVPKYNMNGAAIATSVSWTVSNLVAFYYVKKELNFYPCFGGSRFNNL